MSMFKKLRELDPAAPSLRIQSKQQLPHASLLSLSHAGLRSRILFSWMATQ